MLTTAKAGGHNERNDFEETENGRKREIEKKKNCCTFPHSFYLIIRGVYQGEGRPIYV